MSRTSLFFLLLALLAFPLSGCPGDDDDDDSSAADDDDTTAGDDDDSSGDDDDSVADDDDSVADDDDSAGDDDDSAGDDDDSTPEDADGDGVTADTDCDDSDPDNFPGNTEACDGEDNDCDGSTFADVDGEVDADSDGSLSCDDCNDADGANFPGNPETCDGQDNDCDLANVFPGELVDADMDGSLACADCDDADAANFPGNAELCDGADNDCDGATFATGEDTDIDNDGVITCLDCDDADANNFPGNAEVCDDADNDCDAATFATGEDSDVDSDGVITCLDCDDADAANFPGNTEICDDQDNDCIPTTWATDEDVDADTDGAPLCLDCDDADAANYPGNAEVCDAADNDCDGATFATGEDTDVDGDGSLTCLDCDDADAANYPGNTEVCDDADNDCDATTFASGEDTDADGDGSVTCLDCDDADAANYPGNAEVCDAADNDCDATTFATDEDTDVDSDGVITCLDCDDNDILNFPGNLEVCDNADNDCNGFADFGAADSTWTHTSNGGITNTDFTKGNVLTATASTTVTSWGMDLDVDANVMVTLTIGEGGSPNGPFEIISTVSLGSVASGRQIHSTGAISVPLTAGNSYFFGATWLGGDATNYYGGNPPDPDWGTYAEAAWSNAGAVPAGTAWSPNNSTNLTNGYSMEITAASPSDTELVDGDADQSTVCDDCDDSDGNNTPGGTEICDGQDNDCDATTSASGGEVDGDGDLSFSCADCDDNDPNNAPGNAELCDGVDNDCDATTVFTGEDTDGDSDLSITCADCDDADPANFPGNSEVCDGADNDCDATTVFTGEDTDGDSDLAITCADCDDADPDAFPGNPEVCDGVDNDCDATTGYAGDDWTIGGNSSASFTTGSHIGGTVFEALDVVTITELEGRINGTSDVTPFVATRSGTSGNWTVLAVGQTTTGSGTDEFVSSGPIWVETIVGEQYYIGWHVQGATGFYYRANLNGEPSWSEAIGYAEDDGGTAPTPTLGLSFGTDDEGPEGQYNLIVHTANEDDVDLDLETSCAGDCDDDDPAVNTSGVEVCDGADNDCSGDVDDSVITVVGAGGVSWAAGAPVTSTQDLEQTEGGSIIDVNVTIDIDYDYIQDLTVSVTSPSGTTVELTSGNGGSGNDYTSTTFDDEAAASITTGSDPFSGSWIPEEALSAFDGEDPAGTWTITVDDSHQDEGGTLISWSLDITATGELGDNAFCAADSCQDLYDEGYTTSDRYWVNSGSASWRTYCDQDSDGGGWTLVANVDDVNDPYFGGATSAPWYGTTWVDAWEGTGTTNTDQVPTYDEPVSVSTKYLGWGEMDVSDMLIVYNNEEATFLCDDLDLVQPLSTTFSSVPTQGTCSANCTTFAQDLFSTEIPTTAGLNCNDGNQGWYTDLDVAENARVGGYLDANYYAGFLGAMGDRGPTTTPYERTWWGFNEVGEEQDNDIFVFVR